MKSFTLLEERIITDRNEIERLDKESNLEFFIPPEEIGKLDWELINDERYTKSREEIGELNSIFIAVNPSDPFKDQVSPFRTHFRVVDGRHKYQTSKNSGKVWKHVYVMVKDFLEFDILRTHFGSGKSPQKQVSETKTIIDQRCRYYYDVVGLKRQEISARVVKDLENTRMSHMTIYRHMNPKYLTKSGRGRPKSEKKLSKKDREIERLNHEIDSLNRQLFSVTETRNQLEKEIEDLKSKLNIKLRH